MVQHPDQYLEPTPIIDFNSPAVSAFAAEKAGPGEDPVRQAVNLYYAVRDEIYYDPYRIDLSAKGLRASTTLEQKRGWCVAKAVLLAACCRYKKIPARLGFADVKNHLSTERLRQAMKTDVFYWHGYTDILLDGQWRKATPAFNIGLCEKFHLKPLAFDGKGDSIYHPFDLEGNRHMEYIRFRGHFPDVPVDGIAETFRREYPDSEAVLAAASFDQDVDAKTK